MDEETADDSHALEEYEAPAAYAEGRRHSDLTPAIVKGLRAVHARGQGNDEAFMKVGDSITFSTDFLRCFANTPVAGAEADLEETRTFFTAASWARQSLASTVGWHTYQPYAGNPSPIAREIDVMRPAFAVVMLGTNDVYEGTQPSYEANLTKVVKTLTDRGVIPILSTIPPFRDRAQNAVVPSMNKVVRKVAATAGVPLMDFHLALAGLPASGLSSDGVHPFAARTGACDFSSAIAMNAGYNQRNLLALEALDRVRRAVLEQ